MDCKQAQRLFDDLAHERLAPELAAEVRRHVTECTDCRVVEQRGARLQRLLALKRYERPSPQYFDNFLTEFHRRLLAESQPRIGWWKRAGQFWSGTQVLVWRYGFAGAMGVALAAGLMWMGLQETGDLGGADQLAAVSSPLVVTSVADTTPVAEPLRLPILPADYEPATLENVVMSPVAARTEPATPQYVLDRISVTPASYDVARVYF